MYRVHGATTHGHTFLPTDPGIQYIAQGHPSINLVSDSPLPLEFASYLHNCRQPTVRTVSNAQITTDTDIAE